jgi:hypothetical protein
MQTVIVTYTSKEGEKKSLKLVSLFPDLTSNKIVWGIFYDENNESIILPLKKK